MDEELKKILVCPIDKSELEFHEDKIVCKKCGKEYKIVDGIPDMRV